MLLPLRKDLVLRARGASSHSGAVRIFMPRACFHPSHVESTHTHTHTHTHSAEITHTSNILHKCSERPSVCRGYTDRASNCPGWTKRSLISEGRNYGTHQAKTQQQHLHAVLSLSTSIHLLAWSRPGHAVLVTCLPHRDGGHQQSCHPSYVDPPCAHCRVCLSVSCRRMG